MDGTLVLHDLRRGIPASDASVDAVYHSHVLEHLDRDRVPDFLAEVLRVLKRGGVQRIVVPDIEFSVRRYLGHLETCLSGETSEHAEHDMFVSKIIEQSVRRVAHSTQQQRPLRRVIERAILGDARRRGETHQWLWDRVNLPRALEDAGFTEVRIVNSVTSSIVGWERINLDVGPDGNDYKAGSLYVEAHRN